MALTKSQQEKVFLIGMAVREFNYQYRRKIDPTVCVIKSIRPTYGCKFGYEINTIREDDQVRLRVYFNLEHLDSFKPYRLEVDESDIPGELGDEVYVMIGTLNNYYVDSGTYRFRWLEPDASQMDYMLFMSGEHIEFLSGEKATYVETVG